jgi:transcriptional regulator with XRE-family HTH domain
MIIGEVVKRVAKDRGYGAAALAEAMDMSRRAVYDWFNSDNIGSKTLSQLSKLLEYDFGNVITLHKAYVCF